MNGSPFIFTFFFLQLLEDSMVIIESFKFLQRFLKTNSWLHLIIGVHFYSFSYIVIVYCL